MLMVLLRHGDKVISHAEPNASLSPLGHRQAAELAAKVQAGRLPRPTRLCASPKLRSQQTLAPLAQAVGLNVEVHTALDERGERESTTLFLERIANFIAGLQLGAGPIYCCSHADWLFEAVTTLDSDAIEPELEAQFSCAQVRAFDLQDGLWRVTRL